MSWVGRCPYCGEVFRGRADGKTMGFHRAWWYPLGGGNRRENCPYSNGTREDAERRITPLMRRTQAHIVKLIKAGTPMTEAQRALLESRGMLAETLEMLK